MEKTYVIIELKYDYWINREDKILVKYSESSKVTKGTDTLQEYFAWNVNKYRLNKLLINELKELHLSSIPSYCNLVEYKESQNIELLRKDTLAPIWTLMSLNNENVSLTDLKG